MCDAHPDHELFCAFGDTKRNIWCRGRLGAVARVTPVTRRYTPDNAVTLCGNRPKGGGVTLKRINMWREINRADRRARNLQKVLACFCLSSPPKIGLFDNPRS